jgi:phage/plasmid-like protein (TIGR03299 family)
MSDTQFSAREVPWMKLGQSVEGAVTAAEAMELANLDWEVEMRTAGFQTANGSWRVHPGRAAIVRKDTEDPLGSVAKTYEILQYGDAFDFLDQIHPEYVAAGSLKNGRQAFLVVKAPEHARLNAIGNEDPHDLYVVLRTSHDGSRAVEVNLMPLRHACMNAMPLAGFGTGVGYSGQAQQRWSIRHTAGMHGKLEQAQRVLTGLDKYAREYTEMAERLAAIDLDLEEARKVIAEVTPDYLKGKDKQVDEIMKVYQNSSRNGFQGTGWGVVNAVDEWNEFYRGGDRRRPETRFLQGLDGSTSRAVNRTARVLLTR